MISLKPVSAAQSAKRDPELRKAAEAFEAVILRQMMASMRKAKLGDEMFGSSATDNFREMADARLADNMASMRQFGIADLVERQLVPKSSFPARPPSPFVSSEVETPLRQAQPMGLSSSLEANGVTEVGAQRKAK
jgi:peptidoglycan hydrolase FlgJ